MSPVISNLVDSFIEVRPKISILKEVSQTENNL